MSGSPPILSPRVLLFVFLISVIVLIDVTLWGVIAMASGVPRAAAAPRGSRSYYTHTSTDVSFPFALYDAQSATKMVVSDGDAYNDISDALEADGGPVLWFRDGDRDYVVRDPELLRRANEIVGPLHALGREQGRLGAKQARLGAQQAMLGRQQARYGRAQGAIGPQLSRVANRIARLNRQGVDTSDLEVELRRLEADLREFSRGQAELGAAQAPLGQTQGELGKLQAEMGRQQRDASREASQQMRKLADEALERGLAEPMDR